MRKLLSIFVMICLSTFLIWAAMSWYLGTQAEKHFQQVLEFQTNKLGEKPFRLELLKYKKNVLGSSASVRVSSDMPLVDDWLGDFVLNLKSLNGPVFITKKGVDFGISRWFMRIDPDSFSAESQENIHNIFPELLPTGVIIVGFDKESRFESTFQTEWLDAKLNAVYNLSNLSYRAALAISRFDYSSPDLKLMANKGTINLQYPNNKQHKSDDLLDDKSSKNTNLTNTSITSIDKNTNAKTASIQLSNLNINSPVFVRPITVSLQGNSQIMLNNSMIDAFIQLNLTRLKSSSVQQGENLPIDSLQLTAQTSNIQQARFLQLMETKAEMDNLHMQTQWELQENGELPEGQDKIWQLQNQIHRLNQQYPVSFQQALFSSNNVEITNYPKIEIQTSNANGQSDLVGALKPSLESGGSTRFLDLLEAEAKVTLDDLLYDFLSKRTVIRKKQFSLLYKQNKLLMQ